MAATALQTLAIVMVIGIIAGLLVNRYGRGWFGKREAGGGASFPSAERAVLSVTKGIPVRMK